MNKFRLTISALAVAMVTLAFASLAQAQASRTWVSGVGDDVNPCSRTAPCKTFAGAISKTAPSGEISVLDPAGFGAINITKGMTINGEGTLAGILNAFVTGVIVNSGAADVTLRNISINAPNNGTDGIRIISAKSVTIENVTVNGQSGDGIEVLASAAVNVLINNSQVKNCAGSALKVETSSGLARVTVRHSTFSGSLVGVHARRNSRVIVYESTINANTTGVHVEGNGGIAVAFLKRCQISNNTSHGIQAGGGAANTSSVARITENLISNNGGNGVIISASGGVDSFLNNEINGNTIDGCAGCANVTGTVN